MLSQTTVTAIRALVHLASRGEGTVLSPQEIAGQIGASTSYLSKLNTQLVRAGILRSYRGVRGGVELARPPAEISLLQIVEATQGPVLADYCEEYGDLRQVCGFHRAMAAVHECLTEQLRGWSLGDFVAKPCPSKKLQGKVSCVLANTTQIGVPRG